MKIIVILFFSIFLYSPFNKINLSELNPWLYVYNHALKFKVPDKQARRYADVVVKFSMKYRLDPVIVSGVIRAESDYRWWKKSHKDGKPFAYGPMGVTEFWNHVLYIVDNGRLGRKLKKMIAEGKEIDHTKYFMRIGYGVEAGCIVLRWYIDYAGHLYLGLVAFNHGQNSDFYEEVELKKNSLDTEYVRIVLGGKR